MTAITLAEIIYAETKYKHTQFLSIQFSCLPTDLCDYHRKQGFKHISQLNPLSIIVKNSDRRYRKHIIVLVNVWEIGWTYQYTENLARESSYT